jgi:hypothetical protein
MLEIAANDVPFNLPANWDFIKNCSSRRSKRQGRAGFAARRAINLDLTWPPGAEPTLHPNLPFYERDNSHR